MLWLRLVTIRVEEDRQRVSPSSALFTIRCRSFAGSIRFYSSIHGASPRCASDLLPSGWAIVQLPLRTRRPSGWLKLKYAVVATRRSFISCVARIILLQINVTVLVGLELRFRFEGNFKRSYSIASSYLPLRALLKRSSCVFFFFQKAVKPRRKTFNR